MSPTPACPLAPHPQHPPAVLQQRGELESSAAAAVVRALASPAAAGGDVLVFLPGVGEIRAVARLLAQEQALRSAGVVVQQLHGGLSPQQQDEVIRWVFVCGLGGTERGSRVCFASASAVRFWHGRMCVCGGGGVWGAVCWCSCRVWVSCGPLLGYWHRHVCDEEWRCGGAVAAWWTVTPTT